MKSIFFIILASLSTFAATAQRKGMAEPPQYPQNYFRNPLNIPIYLAGNFGECRPGHFHSGIDIKTQGEENQPVHAAAEGYISRIKMEKGGFGHALYITHPNGYTTLYAHLNDFAPAIQKYLRQQQYEKKHWDVDLQLSPAQFPVKKGQQIAWSGNTGASTAPHLHFEIRDTKTEHPLNPESFGLTIIDKIAPIPGEIVFYSGHNFDWETQPSIYEDGVATFTLAKKGAYYKPIKPDNENAHYRVYKDTVILTAADNGIGIEADDYMEGSSNTIAFYTARLYMDDSLQSQITLDDIGYDVTRYINAYADYKIKEQQHKWIQYLFKLPGNRLDNIYTYLNSNSGRIYLKGGTHKIKIVITDDRDNETTILFYATAKPEKVNPSFTSSVNNTQFYANKPNTFNDANVMFTLDDKGLYDNIMFHFATSVNTSAWSDKYALHYAYIPVHHYFDLQLKSSKPVPNEFNNKVVMMYSDGNGEEGRAATAISNGWYKASVRNFGTYWLDIDTIPPTILSQQKNGSNLSQAKQITFEVKDDKTSVKSFAGILDGKWVCFEQHANLFFYKIDEHCPKGHHELVFTATDENGNTQNYNLKFNR